MLTTEYSASGSAYKTYADFAVFKDDDSYMKYRCEHLYKQSNYTVSLTTRSHRHQ